ncbi:MAG TPA: allophanate hydrolase subunit 1, partial [Syntrophorhabdales bacterium]|nr:allophanate hydrolase subunit 1 [Syntrophorhabdales bacterium]
MRIEPYGENGIRILFGDRIDVDILQQVRTYYSFLKSLDLHGIVEIIPSFVTCFVIFDPRVTSYETLLPAIEKGDGWIPELAPPGLYEIPVMYGGEYGSDLEFVCEYCGLTEDEVIELHTASVYSVFAMGFLPGFPYLGTLDKRLFTPRLETPRLKVPEGSVGVAQLQTGVYPFESPSGW